MIESVVTPSQRRVVAELRQEMNLRSASVAGHRRGSPALLELQVEQPRGGRPAERLATQDTHLGRRLASPASQEPPELVLRLLVRHPSGLAPSAARQTGAPREVVRPLSFVQAGPRTWRVNPPSARAYFATHARPDLRASSGRWPVISGTIRWSYRDVRSDGIVREGRTQAGPATELRCLIGLTADVAKRSRAPGEQHLGPSCTRGRSHTPQIWLYTGHVGTVQRRFIACATGSRIGVLLWSEARAQSPTSRRRGPTHPTTLELDPRDAHCPERPQHARRRVGK